MPDDPEDSQLEKRVEKVEEKVEKVESKVGELELKVVMTDTNLNNVNLQLGRVMSHIESESVLARDDIGKLSKRLFGDDQSKKSGYMGELAHDIFVIKVWVGSVIGATSIIMFLIGIYYFFWPDK